MSELITKLVEIKELGCRKVGKVDHDEHKKAGKLGFDDHPDRVRPVGCWRLQTIRLGP